MVSEIIGAAEGVHGAYSSTHGSFSARVGAPSGGITMDSAWLSDRRARVGYRRDLLNDLSKAESPSR